MHGCAFQEVKCCALGCGMAFCTQSQHVGDSGPTLT